MISIITTTSKNFNNFKNITSSFYNTIMSIRSKLKRALDSNKGSFSTNAKNSKTEEILSLSNGLSNTDGNIPERFLSIIAKMNSLLKEIKFSSPVDYIYNPTEYAHHTFSMYVNRYCNNTKDVLFLGMNPGPWGMVQTGVPFGEIPITRDWLKIVGPVGKPPRESSVRQVTGFDCHRSEVSGKRFWGLFKDLCGTPENFFRHAFTYNYCPLALMTRDGKNVTPADIKGSASNKIIEICDEALYEILKLLEVKIVVGVGRYAEQRANTVLKQYCIDNIRVVFLKHPSPRAVGNERWQENGVTYLKDLNLLKYFKNE